MSADEKAYENETFYIKSSELRAVNNGSNDER